ncbi:hypothetical protein Tco_0397657 [Tanacetum coccineum]
MEILLDRENLMQSIETFLKKFDRISFREKPKVLLIAWDRFCEIKHTCGDKQQQELLRKLLKDVQNVKEELAEDINTPNWDRPAFYYDDDDDDDDEESSIPLRDIIISGLPPLVTILPTGEDIDYVNASPPEAEIVSSEVVEIVIPEIRGIDSDILLTIKDDKSREHLAVPLLFLIILFQIMKLSISMTIILKRRVVVVPLLMLIFLNMIRSSFDLSIDSFPPADRSDFYHEEFADELAHIISPPEYDCFYFKSEPDPGELTSIVDFGIRENVLSTTNVNLPFEDDQSPLLAYVV